MILKDAMESLAMFQSRAWWDAVGQDKLPGELFHYTDTDGLFGILTRKNIWASNIDLPPFSLPVVIWKAGFHSTCPAIPPEPPVA